MEGRGLHPRLRLRRKSLNPPLRSGRHIWSSVIHERPALILEAQFDSSVIEPSFRRLVGVNGPILPESLRHERHSHSAFEQVLFDCIRASLRQTLVVLPARIRVRMTFHQHGTGGLPFEHLDGVVQDGVALRTKGGFVVVEVDTFQRGSLGRLWFGLRLRVGLGFRLKLWFRFRFRFWSWLRFCIGFLRWWIRQRDPLRNVR